MWIIKLPFRILALLLMAVVGTLSVFYKLFLKVSSFVVGIGYLALAICIVVMLMQKEWMGAVSIFIVAVIVFLAVVFAEAVSVGLDALTEKLSEFIFS